MPRRKHPNPRSVHRVHQELTIADVIAAEAAALKLAAAANDSNDVACTLANLARLVEQAQRQLLDDDTVAAAAPGIWRSGNRYTLPKHTRNH